MAAEITDNPLAVPTNGLDLPLSVSAETRAEERCWAPNTRKAYVAAWNDYTRWCLENGCSGLPAAPTDVGRYLEHVVETGG